MFLFPWNCISLSLEMDGEKKVYRDLLFDGRQMVLSVCPVRGHCTHCVLCYFMLQDRLWPWTKQTLVVSSGGFLELHVVFGGIRAGEAAWLRLHAELLFRAPLHLLVINCNLLLPSLVFSKVYMHGNKLEQENKWPGTPGLACSQKRSTFTV